VSIKLSPNEQKIIDYLKANPGKNKTTKVADNTGINKKSFGRYAKKLSEKGLITREYRMEGSVRYWELEIAKQKEKEPEKKVPKSIVIPDEIIPARTKIFADRKKDKIQLANQISKKLINDAKLPKNQQKILMEKYRSIDKDLDLYITR